MRFWSFVLKNVGRRRVRSALTIVGMAIAVAAVVSLVGLSRGFEQSFLAIYQYRKIDLIVQRAGGRQRLTSVLDESLGLQIRAIPGIKQVYAGLVEFASLQGGGALGVLLQGWSPDSEQFRRLEVFDGKRLTADDHDKVLLGRVLADNLNKKVGDKIEVFEGSRPFEVQGIFEGHSVVENGMMIVLLGDLQGYMDLKGKVTGFSIVLDDPEKPGEIQRVRAAIESLAPGISATPVREFVKGTSELQMARGMSLVTSVIAVIIGAVLVLNTMVMSVFERTKEIGILRAIGWSKLRIVRMIIVESLIIGIAGGVVGTVAAIVMTGLLSRLPAASGLVSGNIPPSVVVEGILIAIVVGLLGAIYPAWRGAKLDPTEALRHE